MTSAIMQPTFLPWLGYFDMIDMVNHFVFLDNVQLARRSWQIRNRIKFNDKEFYLTVPITKRLGRDETLISQAIIFDIDNWRKKHLTTLYHAYGKTKHFNEVYAFIEKIYLSDHAYLADFSINIIEQICLKIGINTKFYRASQLDDLIGKKDTLLSSICLQLNCNDYLSPLGSVAYIEAEDPGGKIVQNGIHLYYHNYNHPHYYQKNYSFLPYLCILDLLFNEGFENCLAIIRKGRSMPIYYSNRVKAQEIVKCA